MHVCILTSLAECVCTGNQGFYDSDGPHHVPGSSVVRPSYLYRQNLGSYCNESGEPWCYIPCNTSVCPNVIRHPTHSLWAADLYGVQLCYSADACGKNTKQYNARAGECAKRGGYIKNWKCSCDLGLPCEGDQHQYKVNSTSWVRWTLGGSYFWLCLSCPLLGHRFDHMFILTLTLDGLRLETYLVCGLGCGRDTTPSPRRWFAGVRYRTTQQETTVEQGAKAAALRSRNEFGHGNCDERGADLRPTGAFMIPFEQLEVGQVIALGAQGQVRKGIFSGKAVAIKELLSVLFNPEETTALKV